MIHMTHAEPSPMMPRGFVGQARFAPPPSRRELARQKSFPNVPLVTHRGRTVRFYDDLLKNKIVVLNVMSAQFPDGCATLMSHLAQVQKILLERFAEDVHFYSISATPEHDTPETLHQYAERHGIRGKWWLLTGRADELDHLRRKLGYTERPAADASRARLTDFIRYGNEPRALWGACEVTTSPQQIAEDVSLVIPRPALI